MALSAAVPAAAASEPGYWSGRRVLVTGGGGFVGSWLTSALVSHGALVTVILRGQPPTSNLHLLGLASEVNLVPGSIEDYALLERTLGEHGIETCFHLAAQAIVSAASGSPLSTFDANIRGTWNILEACRASGLAGGVVVASSEKVYGDQPSLPYLEDMPLNGSAPYDVSKVCADLLARSYFKTYRLPVAVARSANVYGGGDTNLSRLVPGTITSIMAGKRPIVRSDGNTVRDYLYVDDVVEAYLMLGQRCAADGVAGEAFNVGAGRPLTAIALVHQVLEMFGATHLAPDVRGVESGRGESRRTCMSSEKAARVLGWRTTVNLDEGLRRTIAWYQRNHAEDSRPPTSSPA